MFFKSALAAGFVAVSAFAASAPAQAHSISVGVHSSGSGIISIHSDGRDWRRDRDWRDDRRDWRRGHGHRAHLSLRQVRRKLRHRGFYDMRFVDRHAPVYKLRATGPRGHRVFLVVSSRSGRIIERHRIRRHR